MPGIYRGDSPSRGERYVGNPAAAHRATRAKKKQPAKPEHHDGGFFGDVGHFFKQGAVDIKNAAVSSPAGIYAVGDAAYRSILKPPPLQSKEDEAALRHVATGLGKQVAEDFKHPLRHPGNTALDLWAAASLGAGSAARIGAAGRVVRAGEGLGAAAKVIARPPKPPPIIMRASGFQAAKPASRAALSRYVQQYVNHLRNTFPEAPIGLQSQVSRVGKALASERKTQNTVLTNPARLIIAEGRRAGIKWDSPEGVAIRAVAEGTPLEQRLAMHRADLATAKTVVARKHLQAQIKATEAAIKQRLVRDGKLADAKLAALYDRVKGAALAHDERLVQEGVMSAGGAQAAIQGPGRVFSGARYEEVPLPVRTGADVTVGDKVRMSGGKADARVAAINGDQVTIYFPRYSRAQTVPAHYLEIADKPRLTGAEDFAGGQFHVGYERYQKPGATFKPPGMGSTKTVRVARYAPPRLRKPLTGGNIHEGMFRNDVPHLVGENIIESERFLAVKRAARFFEAHAADTPEGIKNPVAIATEELKHDPLPQQVKDFQAAQRAAKHGPADRVAGLLYEDWRQRIFPEVSAADFEAMPEVKWIDERLLGDLNKPNPLVGMMQHKVARRGMAAFDQINNVSKFALLYLKPGYALPNIVGNTFLTLTHQGPMAVANLARASRLMVRAGREDGTLIDSLMGEGITGSLGTVAGKGERAVNYAAGKWGQIIDVPFRRAAFLYEARKTLGARPGKAAWPQIHDLLTNPAREAELHEVVTRANRAIIDYGTLNPVEQAIIRRILFFYPWLKGSTKYAGHYVTEHPVQAGAMGNLGQYGQQQIDETLGPLPSWAEGYFKVGGSDQLPLVVNPTAAGILGQPAQLGETLAAFLSGNHVPSAYQISNLFTPALGAGNVTAAGYDPFTHRAVEPNLATWLSQQYQGLPLVTLIQRLQHDQSGRTFPLSKRDALLQFLLGTAAPKPADVKKLNRSAALDRLPPR